MPGPLDGLREALKPVASHARPTAMDALKKAQGIGPVNQNPMDSLSGAMGIGPDTGNYVPLDDRGSSLTAKSIPELLDRHGLLPTSFENFEGPLGFAAGPLATKTGIPGLFSRAEKAVSAFPERINANRALNQLRGATSQEEMAFRGLDTMLQGKQGKAIPTSEIQAQLDANPIKLNVIEKTPRKYTDSGLLEPHQVRSTYDNYVMPNGVPNSYKETLLQLNRGKDRFTGNTPEAEYLLNLNHNEMTADEAIRLADLMDEGAISTNYDQFAGHHWDEPDIIAHIRANDREVPPQPKIIGSVNRQGAYPESEFNQGEYWHVGNIFKTDPDQSQAEQIASVFPRLPRTTPGAVPELKGRTTDLVEMLQGQQPKAPKGRMIENIQSDWHQAGAHKGYQKEGEAKQTMLDRNLETMRAEHAWATTRDDYGRQLGIDLQQLRAEPDGGYNLLSHTINQQLENSHEALPPIVRNRMVQMQNDLMTAEATLQAARDAAARSSATKVPDAPFKDTWAELALKQQIMDVAQRDDLDWIGIAPSHALKKRGEDISPAFQDEQLPNTLAKLLKPFGGNVAPMEIPGATKPPYMSWDQFAGKYGGVVHDSTETGLPHDAIASLVHGQDRGELMKAVAERFKPQPLMAPAARITPEMKKQILEKGFPLLGLMMLANELQPSH